MEYGNTAPVEQDRVNPSVLEDENMVRSLFAQAADTIVEASKLRREVNDVRNDLNSLRSELETMRQRNAWLDEQIGTLREQRNIALSERDETRNELEHSKQQLLLLNHSLDQAQAQITSQVSTIAEYDQENDRLREEKNALATQLEETRIEAGHKDRRITELDNLFNLALEREARLSKMLSVIQRSFAEVFEPTPAPEGPMVGYP